MKNRHSEKQHRIESVMKAAPVIPVIVIDDPDTAVDLARALVAGGLPAIEITLRTARALDCLSAVASQVEGAMAGAGTVVTAAQIAAAEDAGARFLVSPGASPDLLDAADSSEVPLLPGAATAGEMMTLGERGYRYLKFFPAVMAGGAGYLRALAGPLPHYRLCPTGGINMANARDFLALPNVLCVGGSWMAPRDLIAAGDWAAVEALARECASLPRKEKGGA